jgi:hypothetical protein
MGAESSQEPKEKEVEQEKITIELSPKLQELLQEGEPSFITEELLQETQKR